MIYGASPDAPFYVRHYSIHASKTKPAGGVHRLSLIAEVGQSRHAKVHTKSIGPNSTGLKREDDMIG